MEALLQIDWKAVFVPTVSLLEIVLRGTLVYLLLFFVLRVLRREAGALGISDLLVVVLIADAAQNAMGSEYKSVTEGAVQHGSGRVVVARRRAEVPNCPNWSRPASPDPMNRSMSNFGCGVNSNIAAMVANPEDLIHGREGGSVTDAVAAARAVAVYRNKAPTGQGGLMDVSPKGGK